jgi:hypothetical protein
MTFRQALLGARSHLVFILGLLVASALVIGLDAWDVRPGRSAAAIRASDQVPAAPHRPLTPEQLAQARDAWAYFARNTRPSGLADSVAEYPGTTLWDTGSYLLALICAERLGVIDRAVFEARMGAALDAVARLPLVSAGLPNKAYDTRTLAMTDYDGTPSPAGIGWSALDLGRFLVPLSIVAWHYPALAPKARAAIAGWRLDRAAGNGLMYGGAPEGGGFTPVQEGRLGYEQYGARAFALLGRDAGRAMLPAEWLEWVGVDGVEVPVDARRAERYGAHAYVTSEPYVLGALEFGWDRDMAVLAFRVFRAQEERFRRTGKLTAVSEDQLDRPPRFIYSTVYGNGAPWAVLTPDGKSAEAFRILSTKTAFAFDALYGTGYTARLKAAVLPLDNPGQGWKAGIYERTGEVDDVLAANTNAVILEALCYQAYGPLLALQPGREAE